MEMEKELREAKKRELHAQIEEKQAELARMTAAYESMLRMEQAQKANLEKLYNNEPSDM